MDITVVKKHVREQLVHSFQSAQHLTREAIMDRSARIFDTLPRDLSRGLSVEDRSRIVQEMCDDLLGYGPIDCFMKDPAVTEIMVNGPGVIYVEKNGRKTRSDRRFHDDADLRMVIDKMMSPSGRRLDESMPYADFALPDGSRVNVIIPPLTTGGPKLTIRKFLDTIQRVEHLVKRGTLDERMAGFLTACIQARKSILFSGAAGSGKTTSLAAVSSDIDPDDRIVVIEDTPELNLRQDHVVCLLTRPMNIEGKGEISLRDLLRNSLRMRPTRLLMGEIRGAEAMDFLQTLNSGHKGCLAVIHASTPADAVSRLETLALFAGLNLPVSAIRQQIASGLNIIVQQEQLHDGSRKITYITEVRGLADGQVVLGDIFRYDLLATAQDGKVTGRFSAVSLPSDLDGFRRKGIKISPAWFSEQDDTVRNATR